jgi:hypothetical protein
MFDELNDMFGGKRDKIFDLIKLLSSGINKSPNNMGDLGEPTHKETFKEDGFTFEKKVWETEYGKISIIEMVSDENITDKNQIQILNEKLDLAIREERYEYAAKIRDDIKKITESYVTKNETVTDDDWNF